MEDRRIEQVLICRTPADPTVSADDE